MDTQNEVASVTLMILGDDLNPDDVSLRLKLQPSQSWRRGEEKRKAKGSFHKLGGWKLFNENRDASVEEQIEIWMNKLEGKASVFREFREEGLMCSLDTFLAFDEVSTVCLSRELISRISDLGLNLDLCLNADETRSEQATSHNSGGCAPSV